MLLFLLLIRKLSFVFYQGSINPFMGLSVCISNASFDHPSYYLLYNDIDKRNLITAIQFLKIPYVRWIW